MPSCDNYNMEHTQQQTDQSRSIASLTDELLEDLINPSMSALEMCQIHRLTLVELATILESESFKQAAAALARIATARQTIIEPEARALATARLADILKDKPTTPAHAETQRKAAVVLLKPSKTQRPKPARKPNAANHIRKVVQPRIMPVHQQKKLHNPPDMLARQFNAPRRDFVADIPVQFKPPPNCGLKLHASCFNLWYIEQAHKGDFTWDAKYWQ